jgi:hypothetical protein
MSLILTIFFVQKFITRSTLKTTKIQVFSEYKCLQSQFSVLYNDALQIRTSLSDTRNQLMTSQNTHLRHIEQLEVSMLLKRQF